jgi:hypothetical protein
MVFVRNVPTYFDLFFVDASMYTQSIYGPCRDSDCCWHHLMYVRMLPKQHFLFNLLAKHYMYKDRGNRGPIRGWWQWWHRRAVHACSGWWAGYQVVNQTVMPRASGSTSSSGQQACKGGDQLGVGLEAWRMMEARESPLIEGDSMCELIPCA